MLRNLKNILKKPKFSIAIPVYNRSEYLRQAILSVLTQTVSDFELVISDDCSTEDLGTVVGAFSDPRIIYRRTENRLGGTANHQRAVSLSSGEYVITLNSDDLLLPKCLETAGAELDRRSTAAAAYFACTYLESCQIHGCSSIPEFEFADAATLRKHRWLHQFHGTSPSVCLFRRNVFDRLGGYRIALRLAYDWELYIRFLMSGGGVVFIPRILSIYRLHNEQMVQTTSLNGLLDMLDIWPQYDREMWPSASITELVLTQFGTKLRSREGIGGIIQILKEIHRRELDWPLLLGLPGALKAKTVRRLGISVDESERHYIVPLDREIAIEQSSNMLRQIEVVNPNG